MSSGDGATMLREIGLQARADIEGTLELLERALRDGHGVIVAVDADESGTRSTTTALVRPRRRPRARPVARSTARRDLVVLLRPRRRRRPRSTSCRSRSSSRPGTTAPTSTSSPTHRGAGWRLWLVRLMRAFEPQRLRHAHVATSFTVAPLRTRFGELHADLPRRTRRNVDPLPAEPDATARERHRARCDGAVPVRGERDRRALRRVRSSLPSRDRQRRGSPAAAAAHGAAVVADVRRPVTARGRRRGGSWLDRPAPRELPRRCAQAAGAPRRPPHARG